MEELQMLLYEQQIAEKKQDFQLLNIINKKIFAIRQEQRKNIERKREIEHDKYISDKIDSICELERN